MIERYFSQPKVLIRLRSGSVGPHLSRFVSALEQRRLSRDTIRRYIRGADSLCRWLDGQGVAVGICVFPFKILAAGCGWQKS